MSTALLARHPQVVTTELDEARSEVAQRFCSHHLGLTRRDGRLDMVHNAAALGADVTLNYLRYGDEVRIVPGRFRGLLPGPDTAGRPRPGPGGGPRGPLRTPPGPRWAPRPSTST